MNFFRNLKSKWDKWYYHDLDDGDYEWEDEIEPMDDSQSNNEYFADENQRAVYVLECLGQMAEASEKKDQYDAEYQAVTSLLLDMEEIESLPTKTRQKIIDEAISIDKLEAERKYIYSKATKMPDRDIEMMEKMENEIPGGIKKIKEAEEYRKLIKHDLKKLESEKKALHMRKKELISNIGNSRGIAIICSIATAMALVILLFMQLKLDMDVRIGYVLAGGIGALSLTLVYVKYTESFSELEKLGKSVNRLITIHNTVKIRYINNTNLLQYLYMKFDIEDSSELEEKWRVYNEEVGVRQKDEKIKYELTSGYDRLTSTLSANGIKDPEIWIHQVKALYDAKETVEVRHALITRRQKLRDQIEYNQKIAVEAKNKISTLAKKYPQYSSDISQIIERYKGIS